MDELDQIQAERARAQMDYVHKIRSNPKMTPAEKRESYLKLMKDYDDKIEAMHQRASAEREKQLKDQEAKISAITGGKAPVDSATLSTGDGQKAAAPANDSRDGLARPQFVLDGSNIPKELSFPGKKKKNQ